MRGWQWGRFPVIVVTVTISSGMSLLEHLIRANKRDKERERERECPVIANIYRIMMGVWLSAAAISVIKTAIELKEIRKMLKGE